MTNEEAINLMAQLRRYIIGGGVIDRHLDEAVQMAIDALKSNDIIACGDCKHYTPHDKRCGYWNRGVKPLMWCSQAERRWKG